MKSTCQHCQNNLEHPVDLASHTIDCPHCGKPTMLAPKPAGPLPPVPPPMPPNQGVPPAGSQQIKNTNAPSPIVAALASGCCVAGLGQMVCGQIGKGLTLLVGSVVIGVVTGGAAAFVIWPVMAVDAYMVANKLKKGQTVGQWEFFPQ